MCTIVHAQQCSNAVVQDYANKGFVATVQASISCGITVLASSLEVIIAVCVVY